MKDGWNSYEKVTAYGHMTTVNNPLRTFSVLEPGYGDGCARKERVTVMNTAQQRLLKYNESTENILPK